MQQWESDNPKYQTQPRGKRLKRLAEVLGVGERWLRYGVGDPEEGAPAGEVSEPLPGYGRGRGGIGATHEEYRWWEREIERQVTDVAPDLATQFGYRLSFYGPEGRIQKRLDYLSTKIGCGLKLVPQAVTTTVLPGLWDLALIRQMDLNAGVDRPLILYLFWLERPVSETRENRRLDTLRAEAAYMGVEIRELDDPTEAANAILAAEGIQPEG